MKVKRREEAEVIGKVICTGSRRIGESRLGTYLFIDRYHAYSFR